MFRRMDRQGEVLIWTRKCSGYARQRMIPKFTNFCKPEQVSTREYGKMSQRIRVLEDGKVSAMESRNWKIEGLKRMITRTENPRLLNKFETEGFMAPKGLWKLARENVLQDRGEWSKEEGDVVGEYMACMKEISWAAGWRKMERIRKK